MERVRRSVVAVLEIAAAALLVAIMMITVVDVVFRYLLHQPLAASFELTEVLLAMMLFASIAIAMARDDHIEVTLLDPLLARLPRFRRATHVVFRIAIALALSFLAFRMLELGQGKRVEFTPVMHLPLAPVAWFVAIALAVAALLSLLSVVMKNPVGDD